MDVQDAIARLVREREQPYFMKKYCRRRKPHRNTDTLPATRTHFSPATEESDAETPPFVLSESEVICLMEQSSRVMLTQPSLLEINGPVHVVGDLLGNFLDLLEWLDVAGGCAPSPSGSLLFLGDYLGRGPHVLYVICLLMALKVQRPNQVFLLRGWQEISGINRGGFYYECRKFFNVRLWKRFQHVFDCMPLAALVGGRIFCVHSGLSPCLHNLDVIRNIVRPMQVGDSGVEVDLLNSCPDKDICGWQSFALSICDDFGPDVVEKACRVFGWDLIVRSHSVVEQGYEYFGDKQQLLTIVSAAILDFDNNSAMLYIDGSMQTKIIQPAHSSSNLCVP